MYLMAQDTRVVSSAIFYGQNESKSILGVILIDPNVI